MVILHLPSTQFKTDGTSLEGFRYPTLYTISGPPQARYFGWLSTQGLVSESGVGSVGVSVVSLWDFDFLFGYFLPSWLDGRHIIGFSSRFFMSYWSNKVLGCNSDEQSASELNDYEWLIRLDSHVIKTKCWEMVSVHWVRLWKESIIYRWIITIWRGRECQII